jgi:RNA polymerase sigma-70 factor (ECF subfamily)
MDDLETLYTQHATAVYRFALGLSGDPATAEDLVSETFFRILTRAPELRTQTALAYLLAVARNAFLQGRRRRQREAPLPEVLPDPSASLVTQLDGRQRLESVLLALGQLPEGERAALLLRLDQGLAYEEIAAALGISTAAAKVRVHRARLKLLGARDS